MPEPPGNPHFKQLLCQALSLLTRTARVGDRGGVTVSWLEISVTVDPEVAESVSDVFNRLNPTGDGRGGAVVELHGFDPVGNVHDLKATVRTYVPDTPEGRERLRRIEEALGHLNMIRPVPEPTVRRLQESDWRDAWKKHFVPLRVGRVLIIPAWIEQADVRPEDVVVRLEPGMAFGTGLHPSTRLALRLVQEYVRPGQRVLDVGTGSGILAVAAAKLGAKEIVATDIDPLAVQAARENAVPNGVAERIHVQEGSLPEDKPFDLVVVNILHHVILNLLDRGLWEYVRPGGYLLLSGIVLPHETEVLLAISARGGRIVERLQEEDWTALAVLRGESS